MSVKKHSGLGAIGLPVLLAIGNQVHAGGFDKSLQHFNEIYSNKTQLNFSYADIRPQLTGKYTLLQDDPDTQYDTGNIVQNTSRPVFSFTTQLGDGLRCAGKVEEPYGGTMEYADDTIAYTASNGTPVAGPQKAAYESFGLVFGCGADIQLESGKVTFFAGPRLTNFKASFVNDMLDANVGDQDNVSIEIDADYELGYLVGGAYSLPDYGLRASFLYRSEITWDATGSVDGIVPGYGRFDTTGGASFKVPQTLELALQSGIAPKTLGFMRVKWADYDSLDAISINVDASVEVGDTGRSLQDINENDFGGQLKPLYSIEMALFNRDTVDYSIGVARLVSDKYNTALAFSGSYKLGEKFANVPDGADMSSMLAAGNGYKNLAWINRYQLLPQLQLTGTLGYTILNGYVIQDEFNSIHAKFDDGHAWVLGFGASYML